MNRDSVPHLDNTYSQQITRFSDFYNVSTLLMLPPFECCSLSFKCRDCVVEVLAGDGEPQHSLFLFIITKQETISTWVGMKSVTSAMQKISCLNERESRVQCKIVSSQKIIRAIKMK